jgi:hypothetical protein
MTVRLATPVALVLALGPLAACDDGLGEQLPGGAPCTPDTCTPETLASKLLFPTGLAVDQSSVYWDDGDSILKAPLGGGSPVALASGQFQATSIAVEDGLVYWIAFGAGKVVSMPVAGGAPTVLVSGQDLPQYLALGGDYIYWTSGGREGACGGCSCTCADGTPLTGTIGGACTCADACSFAGHGQTGAGTCGADTSRTPYTVSVAPRTGGAATELFSTPNEILSIAADQGRVYWTVGRDSDPVGGGVIMTSGPAGEALGPLAGTEGAPALVRAFSGWLFWVDEPMSREGTIMKMPARGGAPTVLAANQDVSALAADASGVYWTTSATTLPPAAADGALLRVPLLGGSPVTLVDGLTLSFGIALDETSVYWTDIGPLLQTFAGVVTKVNKTSP